MSTIDTTILELSQAAERIHGTVHFVRGLIASGELKYLKIGKKFCVTAGDLANWIETTRQVRSEADDDGDSLGQARVSHIRRKG
jgi:hypothetical protein